MEQRDVAKEEGRRRDAWESPLASPPARPLSFAERTGQRRRQAVSQGIVVASGALFLVVLLWRALPHRPLIWLASIVLGAIGFVAHCLSVRCPRCRVAVVWHTYNTRSVRDAETAATYQTVCPRCGYDPL